MSSTHQHCPQVLSLALSGKEKKKDGSVPAISSLLSNKALLISSNNVQQEAKKQKPSLPSRNEFGDSIFVDVKENKAPSDHPVPMFLEQTEAIPDETDQMVISLSLPEISQIKTHN